MKKSLTVIGCILFCLAISFPIVSCAKSISKPTVSLPANWYLESETPYPEEYSEYDPEGAGLLVFWDEVNYDFVMLYYEKAPDYTLTESALKSKAANMFLEYHQEYTLDESGTTDIAGEVAGYAIGYDSELDINRLEIVFVKNGVFLNAYAYYTATSEDWNEVKSLLDSISVGDANGGFPWILIIVPIVVAIAVVIVVVIFLLKRQKKPVKPTPETPAPEPVAESRWCMECGHRLSAKGFYCNNCGSSPQNFGGPMTKACHCGTVIPATAKFCSACGAKQAPT
jgi:hypothetical protein